MSRVLPKMGLLKRCLLVTATLSCASAALAADGPAVVSGVVRNAEGVAQMGALVQVFSGSLAPAATAYTDLHGRYVIANLQPGRYFVRASATLFVPATRSNLQLRTGVTAVVNLTLAALFDTASWLPADRRHADEPADDWKWTLRSPANRPILRVFEQDGVLEVSTSATETAQGARTHARAGVVTGDGSFGQGGVHNILTLDRLTDDGGSMVLRANLASSVVPGANTPSQSVDAGYERRMSPAATTRALVSYASHPEIALPGHRGMESMRFASGQRLQLGDRVEVEAGSGLEAVHTDRLALRAMPFLRVTAQVGGHWILRYKLATDRSLQQYDDISPDDADLPVVRIEGGRTLLESDRHQELAVARSTGRGVLTVAYYHDRGGRVAVAGGASAGPLLASGAEPAPGMTLDPITGSFRALVQGVPSNGVRLSMTEPIGSALWLDAEFSTGRGLVQTGDPHSFAEALRDFDGESAYTGTVALRGRVPRTGTQMRASYRWQPARMVSTLDPFSATAGYAFLSCHVRQPIRWSDRLPRGLDATIDVTNLLAEGYRPFVSEDGQTLYFAQSPRAVQGGVSFTF